MWYLVAKYTGFEYGIVAVLIGYVVGLCLVDLMKIPKSTQLGIIGAVLVIPGIILAKFLIWYDVLPTVVQQELTTQLAAQQASMTGEQLSSDFVMPTPEEIRTEYTFVQYLQDDVS